MNHTEVNKIVEALRGEDSNIILKQNAIIQILREQLAGLDKELTRAIKYAEEELRAHLFWQKQYDDSKACIDAQELAIKHQEDIINRLKIISKRRPWFVYVINRRRKIAK